MYPQANFAAARNFKRKFLNIFFPVVLFITLKYKVVITFELWI